MTSDTSAKTVVAFTIPNEYAERMHHDGGGFYLDVFGWVRDSVTTDSIGRWEIVPESGYVRGGSR